MHTRTYACACIDKMLRSDGVKLTLPCPPLPAQLERCQLGYQQGGLSAVYDSLYHILRKAQNRTLAGDVDMFAINLHRLLDLSLNFPAVAPRPDRSSFNLSVKGCAH